jgi:RES domain-containing protein
VTLVHRAVAPADHLWVRVCHPDWADPFDPGFAPRVGGRWTPVGSWPTLYLSRDVATARLQVARLLEGTSVAPDDLTDDAFELVAARLPRGQVAVDVVTAEGVAAAGLPPTYPDDGRGARVAHRACWAVAMQGYDDGLDGVECRSAASSAGTGREFAWWPRGRRPRPRDGRIPYGAWRAPDSGDARALFAG